MEKTLDHPCDQCFRLKIACYSTGLSCSPCVSKRRRCTFSIKPAVVGAQKPAYISPAPLEPDHEGYDFSTASLSGDETVLFEQTSHALDNVHTKQEALQLETEFPASDKGYFEYDVGSNAGTLPVNDVEDSRMTWLSLVEWPQISREAIRDRTPSLEFSASSTSPSRRSQSSMSIDSVFKPPNAYTAANGSPSTPLESYEEGIDQSSSAGPELSGFGATTVPGYPKWQQFTADPASALQLPSLAIANGVLLVQETIKSCQQSIVFLRQSCPGIDASDIGVTNDTLFLCVEIMSRILACLNHCHAHFHSDSDLGNINIGGVQIRELESRRAVFQILIAEEVKRCGDEIRSLTERFSHHGKQGVLPHAFGFQLLDDLQDRWQELKSATTP